MARRLVMFGLLAALSQLGTGCCCVRQCIANRWHYFHGQGCGSCCTPSFKVPSPLPVYHGAPVSAGCPSCYSPPDVGPVVPGPVAFAGPIPSGPVGVPSISAPMPLLPGPTVEPSTAGSGIPSPMPSKGPN